MIELALKMLLCLIVAALLGAIIGYILGRISKCDKDCIEVKNIPLYDYDELEQQKNKKKSYKEVPVSIPDAVIKPTSSKGIKPIAYPVPRNGVKDDLKKIQGIGINVENALFDIGVFHYSQIADWTNENIEWVENYLENEGRVRRENWIFQAKTLMLNTQL